MDACERCEHVTCNATTDYELVRCDNEATYRIRWPGYSQIACELHVKMYRDILTDMAQRNAVKVWPDFVRLEQ